MKTILLMFAGTQMPSDEGIRQQTSNQIFQEFHYKDVEDLNNQIEAFKKLHERLNSVFLSVFPH